MARPVKIGFDYFPFDVNLLHDIKIRKLIKRNGGGAVTVYLSVLSLVYKGGYYVKYDSDTPFVLSELTGFDEQYISGVVDSCLSLDLFSKSLFDTHNVLTSIGIQRRYIAICQNAKRKVILDKYSLILENKELILSSVNSEEIRVSSEEIPVNSEETEVNSEEIRVSSEFGTQRKEKKSKVKKSKVNKGMQNKELISHLTPQQIRDIVAKFNAIGNNIPQVIRLTEKRIQSIQAVIAEIGEDFNSILEAVFLKIKESKFLGGGNKRNWVLTFDCLFSPNGIWLKIYEGNYDNRVSEEMKESTYPKCW